MSRFPVLPTEQAPPSPPPLRGGLFEDLPAWLVSLIGHMMVVILLALLYIEPPAPPMTELFLEGADMGAGDLGGDDLEMGGSEFGSATEPTDDVSPQSDAPIESLAAADPSDLAEPLAAEWGSILPSTELTSTAVGGSLGLGDDAIGGMGDGNGGGRGNGRGLGDGDGDGRGPGDGVTGMFGLVDEGGRFAYVFDRSESMNSVFTLTGSTRSVSITPIEAAKNELIRSIEALGPNNLFSIVFYNHEALLFEDAYSNGGVFAATTEGKRSAKDFIRALPAEGFTNHLAGLALAFDLDPKPEVIFLLTDGEAKDDPTPGDVRRVLKMCRQTGTRINVIHFSHVPRPDNTLERMAKGTGGQYLGISIRDLANAMW